VFTEGAERTARGITRDGSLLRARLEQARCVGDFKETYFRLNGPQLENDREACCQPSPEFFCSGLRRASSPTSSEEANEGLDREPKGPSNRLSIKALLNRVKEVPRQPSCPGCRLNLLVDEAGQSINRVRISAHTPAQTGQLPVVESLATATNAVPSVFVTSKPPGGNPGRGEGAPGPMISARSRAASAPSSPWPLSDRLYRR